MTSVPENKIKPPEWLSEEYVIGSLRKGLKDEAMLVESYDLKPATSVGDNYASRMFRATLSIRKTSSSRPETRSVIIKVLPEGEIGQLVRESNAFGAETNMYANTLPAVNALLRKAFANHEDMNAACYYHEGPPREVLMMEDLKVIGYTLASRFGGVDLTHARWVVESLAKLHAASYVLLEADPTLKDTYRQSVWDPQFADNLSNMMKSTVRSLSEEISEWHDYQDAPKFAKKLADMEGEILPKLFSAFKRDESRLNVLIHGDCWTNNMMFLYDEKKIVGHKFVDYQLATWNSPATDLNYFIFSSVKDEFKIAYIPFLLKMYHEALNNNFKALGVTLQYSLDDLTRDFRDKLFFGFVATITVFPITQVPPSGAPDINEMINNSNYKNTQMYKTTGLKNVLKRVLPYFEKSGIL